jgi:hypothetical protein
MFFYYGFEESSNSLEKQTFIKQTQALENDSETTAQGRLKMVAVFYVGSTTTGPTTDQATAVKTSSF